MDGAKEDEGGKGEEEAMANTEKSNALLPLQPYPTKTHHPPPMSPLAIPVLVKCISCEVLCLRYAGIVVWAVLAKYSAQCLQGKVRIA